MNVVEYFITFAPLRPCLLKHPVLESVNNNVKDTNFIRFSATMWSIPRYKGCILILKFVATFYVS